MSSTDPTTEDAEDRRVGNPLLPRATDADVKRFITFAGHILRDGGRNNGAGPGPQRRETAGHFDRRRLRNELPLRHSVQAEFVAPVFAERRRRDDNVSGWCAGRLECNDIVSRCARLVARVATWRLALIGAGSNDGARLKPPAFARPNAMRAPRLRLPRWTSGQLRTRARRRRAPGSARTT